PQADRREPARPLRGRLSGGPAGGGGGPGRASGRAIRVDGGSRPRDRASREADEEGGREARLRGGGDAPGSDLLAAEARRLLVMPDPARQRLIEKARDLPERPGVYLFKDTEGTILYIGKARSLRDRVRNYFGS